MMTVQTLLTIFFILVALGAVAFIIFYKRGVYKKASMKILFSLVAEAEKQFGAKTGLIKNSYVFRCFYEAMPVAFKFLFTQDQILQMIEVALKTFKDYLKINTEAAQSLGVTI